MEPVNALVSPSWFFLREMLQSHGADLRKATGKNLAVTNSFEAAWPTCEALAWGLEKSG